MGTKLSLIVCPEIETRCQLVSTLGPSFVCDVAVSGKEAIEILEYRAQRFEHPGLIVVDYRIEDVQPDDLLAAIRKQEEKLGLKWPKSARIMAMSASERDIVLAFFKGAEAGHTLPFNAEKFLKQLETLEIKLAFG
jgi:two-component system, chemotaxis family, chemotaxis protein CheY